jgi:phosphatidylglycerol:prolipoprotein diacylglycerol transferase
MWPVLFRVFGLPIHGYGLMIVVGFLLATWIAQREARRRGLPEFAYDLGLIMLLGGILGGRIFYYAQFYRSNFAGRPLWEFFKLWEGGLVFYGGAIGGFLGGWIYLKAKKLPLLDCLDVAALGAPIGMAFGRLGCYLNGCCFGRLCSPDFPLGVSFPATVAGREPAPHRYQVDLGLIGPDDGSLPVHPVQLYQAGHDFLLFGLLGWFLRRRNLPRGVGMPLLFMLYGIGRFFLEGLRADHDQRWFGLTISQLVSLGAVGTFGFVLIFLWRNGLRATQPST